MWLRYRDYTIEVTAKKVCRLWVADICIKRVNDGSKALQAKIAEGVYDNQAEAEVAGLTEGMERVDRLLEGKPGNQ